MPPSSVESPMPVVLIRGGKFDGELGVLLYPNKKTWKIRLLHHKRPFLHRFGFQNDRVFTARSSAITVFLPETRFVRTTMTAPP
jgi:hypothetical protein